MLFFKRRRRPKVSASVSPEIVALVEGSGLFDAGWYLATYPEVAGFGGGPLGHFCEHGLHEFRDPGPEFSHAVYRRRAPDAFKGTEPPFVHAMRGRSLDTEPLWWSGSPDALRRMMLRADVFDAAFYLRDNPDIARAGGDPFAHFCANGAYEHRRPGPAFEPDFYVEQHPDFAKRYATPIEDWLRYGRPKGWAGSGPPLYARWIDTHDTLTPADADAIRADAERDPPPPVAIVHVLDDAALAHRDAIRAGLRAQIGVAWRAWFVPAPGLDGAAWRTAVEACADEPRLRWLSLGASLPERLAEAGADDGVTLVCFGPVALRPHAAYAFARGLADAGADAAYSDHDILHGSERSAPRFKPAFSAEYLRHAAYTGPVLALRRAPEGATPGQAGPDMDADAAAAALLRRFEARSVARLPLILYHRLVPEPVRAAPAAEAPPPLPDPAPTVDIVIPTRDRAGLLRACIDSIRARTDYPAGRFGILVVDNGSAEPETLAYFEALRATPGVRVVASPGRFNFSRINNDGVAASRADIVVLLNNDTTVNRPDWLRHLAGHAGDPSVGAVGAQLLYPDDTLQHGGVVLGIQGVGAHRHVGVPADAVDPPDATRDVSAVTGACLAIRRQLFLDLGGLDPVLEVAFNDVKLCASAVKAGYRTIYVGLPLLHHHESRSRGLDDTPAKILRNLREATYVIGQFPDLFRDDPSYNPNLSLNRIDDLAFPPRIVRPWRRTRATGRASDTGRRARVLLLSLAHRRGYGVPVVLALQARALLDRGFEVIVGGPVHDDDTAYPGCRRVALLGERQAANFAVSEGVDGVVAHTPPFYTIARHLGRRPLFYAMDYGEPDPEFFEDRAQREAINREKRLATAFAQRVFCISRAIYHQQYRRDAIVARLGNAHLDAWSEAWAGKRPALRERYGFGGRFVVLNVCRFHQQERDYKGVDRTIEIAGEFPILYPDLADACVFALAGRGDPEDVAFVEASGLTVFANVADAELLDLYAASDLYMNFSRWEGYNLGIGQALAMGLPAIASDIEAHREFPIDTAGTVVEACALLARAIRAGEPPRTVFIEPWAASLDLLCDTLEADLAAQDPGWM